MQTQHIVSFYHVARLRTITKAADIQGLAQPTVTSHLKKLEEELGFSLFDRIKRPIMLTSDGAAVLEMIGPIVNGLSALKIHADSQGRDVSLTIVAYADLVLHYLPQVIQRFRTEYPNVHIRLLARHHGEMIQMARSGEVDLALSTTQNVLDSSLDFMDLFTSSTMMLTPLGHELLEQQPVRLEDISKWPLILYGPNTILRTRLERAFREQGLDYEMVMEMDNVEYAKRYVRIGMGISFCSNLSLEPEDYDTLGIADVDHLFSNVTIGMYTLKGKFQGTSVRNFIDSLRGSRLAS
ncbi:MAG: LysR family transcriptional regulator [Candidatus Poseidoniales archaeon]|nr:LysR family transcriptional regulator [Candidatus Poseidoniales archaeon]